MAPSGGWFCRNERVQKYVPQVLSKYGPQLLLHRLAKGDRWSLLAWHSLPLALLLTLLLLAKLAGETTLSGAAHWIWLCGGWLNEHLHLERTNLARDGLQIPAMTLTESM